MSSEKMCKAPRKAKEKNFECKKCGNKAKKEKHLCKPVKIEKNN